MNKKLNLKVTIDDASGFCFGVVNAISKAEEALAAGQDVYCLGQIVHNDEEVKRLEKLGLKTIEKDDLLLIHDKTILFRAHGEPPSSYNLAKDNNNTLIDASCSIIIVLQRKIKKAFEAGEFIVIFGKRNHPEVIALNAQTENKSIVFEHIEELENVWQSFPQSISLFSQTTMSLSDYEQSKAFIQSKGIKVAARDTVCRQVSNRENDLIKFSTMHDKIVFVAGKKSSNGKVLFNVCKHANMNTFFVSSVNDINSTWFSEFNTIGICGATSTPHWLIEEVEKYLMQL